MEESLYSEYGFFNTEKTRSNKEGDFLTSPEVSDYFGLFISNWMNENEIENNVVEVGAGTGSLASQVHSYSKRKPLLVEKSVTASKTLSEKDFKVYKTIDLISETEVDLIYMNEVLDNISCSIGVFKENKWFEKVVKIDSDRLSYDLSPIRSENLNWIDENHIKPLDDIEIEIQWNTQKYLEEIVSKLNPKLLLIIDYGYEFHERKNKPYKSLIRTYKNHHLAGETILQPASTDITYDVNFSSVESSLSGLNYEVELSSQKEFLYKYGFEDCFKTVQTEFQNSKGLEQLKLKSNLVGLEAINNSRGLGGFKILSAKKI